MLSVLFKTFAAVMPSFWLLVGVSFLLRIRRRWRLARWLLLTAMVWLLLSSTAPLPCWLVSTLEDRYQVFNGEVSKDAKPHILVLGGGHTSDLRLPATNQLSLNAFGRLGEGIRIHRTYPGSLLILSGYCGRGDVSTGEVMFLAAKTLGVDVESMMVLSGPRTTHEEAIAYRERFGTSHPLIVVTSATHTPRAMMWFRAEGLDPVPAPTNHAIKYSAFGSSRWWFPNSHNVNLMDRAIYEYGGMVQTTMRLRRDE